jgi:hypothetical protein
LNESYFSLLSALSKFQNLPRELIEQTLQFIHAHKSKELRVSFGVDPFLLGTINLLQETVGSLSTDAEYLSIILKKLFQQLLFAPFSQSLLLNQ